ncbi:hypothetical protein ECEC1864_4585, partial [Escherichia coli EC1864]
YECNHRHGSRNAGPVR